MGRPEELVLEAGPEDVAEPVATEDPAEPEAVPLMVAWSCDEPVKVLADEPLAVLDNEPLEVSGAPPEVFGDEPEPPEVFDRPEPADVFEGPAPPEFPDPPEVFVPLVVLVVAGAAVLRVTGELGDAIGPVPISSWYEPSSWGASWGTL